MSICIERAKEITARFGQQRILVVGDLMLDRFIYGTVSRISPEAPVPVICVEKETSMPGGASNVARNIQFLGGQSLVSGVIGQDAHGRQLMNLLEDGGVRTSGVLVLDQWKTTVKTRIIAEHQQVCRVDWDALMEYDPAIFDQLCAMIDVEVEKATGVIIEDYGKGIIQQRVVDTVIQAARRRRIPTGFDPKDYHELAIQGITMASPNRHEAFCAVAAIENKPEGDPLKDEKLLRVARALRAKWDPELLMLTLGSKGMLLVEKDKDFAVIPTRAREVFDVSGAGDTVIATGVLALAAGATRVEAAELANYAAGVVVGKLGTATCSTQELIQYMDMCAG